MAAIAAHVLARALAPVSSCRTAPSPAWSRPGNPLPDDRGFLVLWANEEAVARAFDMQGAFGEAMLTLAPGASEPAVIAELDRLLLPWGRRGAYGRRDQPAGGWPSGSA